MHMSPSVLRRCLIFAALACLLFGADLAGADDAAKSESAAPTDGVACWPAHRAKCRPVPMGDVAVGGFLGKRIDQNLDSVLAALESPIPRGFEARAAGKEPPPETRRLAAED